MQVNSSNGSLQNRYFTGTGSIGGIHLPDFNDKYVFSKKKSGISDEEYRKQIREQAYEDTVQETLFQPFSGLRHADGGTGLLVAFHGRGADAGMDGCIVGAHVILKQPAKLCQRGDGIHVQCIEPGFFQRPELALDLCLGSSVTDLCM